MDDKVKELNEYHAIAGNILCASGGLEDVLQLYDKGGMKYQPLTLWKQADGRLTLDNFWLLYQGFDREYDSIPKFFNRDEESIVFHGREGYNLPYHHLLNLPNTPEDVRFRQEGVKELVENESLFKFVEDLLASQEMYGLRICRDHTFKDMSYWCDVTPEKMSGFIDRLSSLKDLNLQSGPFRNLINWGIDLKKDILFQELFQRKRKVTDSRVFAVYSERFREVRYGLLKPGVKPEEVFDFLDPGLDHYSIEKTGRGRRKVTEVRDLVKYKQPEDQLLVKLAVGNARQRMDVLNEISSKTLAIPGLLIMLQMKHIYQGAYMYKELKRRGYPAVFPEICNVQGFLDVQDLLPIRMILEESHGGVESGKQDLASNSFKFNPLERIVQIEGPNKRGKSEAWRSLHLFTALTNAGYPVPAIYARTGIVPASHFISCKGDRGYGGSELERSLEGIKENLQEVHNGDEVILDELGDASNAPTSLEIAKRLIPQLVNRGCRVLVTSHHHTLTSYISEELKGISFMPDPNGNSVLKFRLVPSAGEIDFKPQETLDDIGFTESRIGDIFPNKSRPCARRRDPESYEYYEERFVDGEDIPF